MTHIQLLVDLPLDGHVYPAGTVGEVNAIHHGTLDVTFDGHRLHISHDIAERANVAEKFNPAKPWWKIWGKTS